jgi:glycogen debranching enzyme
MNEFVQIADAYYVRASSSRIDDRTHVLKCEESFAVLDRRGDVHPHGRGHQGLYHRGTRFLSRLEVTVAGTAPLLLRSAPHADGAELLVDATNPDLVHDGAVWLTANQLHVSRRILLTAAGCLQRFVVRSHALVPLELALTVHHDADFRDVFEVRGATRERRGEMLEPMVGADRVVLRYRGLDDVVRAVAIAGRPLPSRHGPTATTFTCQVEPGAQCAFEVVCSCGFGEQFDGGAQPTYDAALAGRRDGLRELRGHMARFETSSASCNAWLDRSATDVLTMLASTHDGWYPHAGVPWYATVFGRDGVWTAFECLLVEPRIARGVLAHLAAMQAQEFDAARDAEPGKILHEQRDGEMAALGEIPFGRYYGTVDATPLFVLLAGEYWRRTADVAFVRQLWPAVTAALDWCARVDARGFVAYQRSTPRGLANQGWKDSHDAVFHADGRLADGPIALCEVQAYVHAARLAGAELATVVGAPDRARAWRDAAAQLREAFERHFWCEGLGSYALALDGAGEPCCVRTSNPGHCLLGELVAPERARAVVAALLASDSWSGFGIRTVGMREPRFNPMAYHNGSVWPHDNAVIAWGMARRGFRREACQVFTGLLHASERFELHRLPELFCGMQRRGDEGPITYPVACSPQAWASASAFLLLQACLGVEIDAVHGEVRVNDPHLPPDVRAVSLANLDVAGARVDLEFTARAGGRTDVRLRGDARLMLRS